MMARHPSNHRAAFGGESIELDGGRSTLVLYKRSTGWGWAELIGPDGVVLAVMDHLGELELSDSPVPMRLEAEGYSLERTDEGHTRIIFDVRTVSTGDALSGSSFDSWIGAVHRGPVLTGQVVIAETPELGGFRLEWRLTAGFDVSARYLRGPWVRVGATSFGSRRDDAILPGVEWALDAEWTSGDDWFRDPWAMRAVPRVDTVAIPMMAVSHAGESVQLSWDPAIQSTGWFSLPRERIQPVFASPNFIERNDSSLLGLMIPEARTDSGDQWRARDPLELHRGQLVSFAAVLATGAGSSLDAVAGWVLREGLPDTPEERWAVEQSLHKIAHAYANNLWHAGEGFGLGQSPGDITPRIPSFARRYLERFPDAPAALELRTRIESLGSLAIEADAGSSAVETAEILLTVQAEDGSFRFDPDGRHRSKDDFLVARDLVAPMGQAGDRALDLDATAAITLLRAYRSTGDGRFAEAARSALDHARGFRRPEGGDFWETPLHSPNLLAAGHGAVAHALAWKIFGREHDRVAARKWLRSILVFTHLWSPAEHPMLYNTKPCLSSSDWYFANWVRDHVQWEVLETFALMAELELDFAEIDPEIDWPKFHRGITFAAVRWLIDEKADTWRPHNIPGSMSLYRDGRFQMCLPDTHNSTTGLYGGMAIMPNAVALNLLALQ